MRSGYWYLPLLVVVATCLTGAVNTATAAQRTVEQVVEKYRDKVEARLTPRFRFAGVEWPPQEVQLLAIKETQRLELWVRSADTWHFIRDYGIKGISGGLGPKLKEGDRQVPEGIYRIVRLNPNSSFHLSLKVDYPNEFDRAMAKQDRRRGLGGEIYIHGNNVSRGCLAIGDNAVEELFVLSALLGKEKVRLLISPIDFRIHPTHRLLVNNPRWIGDLYQQIAVAMREFQR